MFLVKILQWCKYVRFGLVIDQAVNSPSQFRHVDVLTPFHQNLHYLKTMDIRTTASTPSGVVLEDAQSRRSLRYPGITHVIFDLDGTLLDTETVYEEVYSQVCRRFGKQYSLDVRMRHVGTSEKDTARIITTMLNLPISQEEFIQLSNAELQGRITQCALMPGVDRLLRHFTMHEVPMAMATSNPYPHMDAKLTNYPEVRLAFHHIVCGGTDPEVKMGKPAPDIFLVAASRFPGKPQPAQVLVFEDSVAGVKGAIAAGMHVVAVPDRTVPHDTLSGATIILDSLAHFHPELFGFPPF